MPDPTHTPTGPDRTGSHGSATFSVRGHLGHRLRVLAILATSVLLDAAVLVAWVVVNWCSDHYVIAPMRLHGTDQTVLVVLRWVLGLATLVAVLAFVVEDLIAIVAGVVRRVRSAD